MNERWTWTTKDGFFRSFDSSWTVETKTVKIVHERTNHERNLNELVHERRTVGFFFEKYVHERTLNYFFHRSFIFRSSFERDPPWIFVGPPWSAFVSCFHTISSMPTSTWDFKRRHCTVHHHELQSHRSVSRVHNAELHHQFTCSSQKSHLLKASDAPFPPRFLRPDSWFNHGHSNSYWRHTRGSPCRW